MSQVLDIVILPAARPEGRTWRTLQEFAHRAQRRFSAAVVAEAAELLKLGKVFSVTVGSDFIEARVGSLGGSFTAVCQAGEDDLDLECECPAAPDCCHVAAVLRLLEDLPPDVTASRVRAEQSRPEENPATSAGVRVGAGLSLVLDPWKPSVRFLLQEDMPGSRRGSLASMRTFSLSQLARWLGQASPTNLDDRELVSCLRRVRWPMETKKLKEWQPSEAEFRELLPALAGHPRVYDHHGQSLQIEMSQGLPLVRLSAEDGHLWAELIASEALTDPGLSEAAGWRIRGIGYSWDDPRPLRAARRELLESGFEAQPCGRFRLPQHLLDHWVARELPCWRRRARPIQIDPTAQSLLRVETTVQSRFTILESPDIDWFELKWELEADGEPLSQRDLRLLRVFPGQFLRLENGRMVSLEPGRIRHQMEELSSLGYSPAARHSQRLPLCLLSRVLDLASTSPENLQVSTPLRRLHDQLQGHSPRPRAALPAPLKNVMRGYQKDGFDFLEFLCRHRLGAILADDMGLGKTLQTLALMLFLKQLKGRHPSLVVCPTSVAPNWLEEAAKFTPELRCLHLKNGLQLECDDGEYDLLVTSYGLVSKLRNPRHFRCVVLDEAHHIKNPRAQRTRAVKKLQADFKLALTGTPIENHVTELWSLFDFLLPGLLGSATGFQKAFARPIMKEGNAEVLQQLTEVVRPFILRRLKSEVAPELPPKIEQNVYCELGREQKRLYREVANRVRGEVDQQVQALGIRRSRIPILTALMRLRQLCCHPGLIDPRLLAAGSAKLDVFLEQLEGILSGGHRVLVFSQFVGMLRILEESLVERGIDYLYLDGSTRDRAQAVRRFQDSGSRRVFLMSLKAGGTGLNLTAADYVILYDPWWNPAVEQQAIDRIYRIGQDKPVTAYRFITKDTVEEKMLELHRRKQSLAESLLESQLSEEELLDLLSLSD